MKLTSLGHAGFILETNGLRILCDPWFTPTYFATWFPFPRNDQLDLSQIAGITHLYVSHPHKDHFDRDFLKQYVSKDVTVILPVYPLPLFERDLRELGFSQMVCCSDGERVSIGNGVTVTVNTYTASTDGGVGDSCMLLDDGEVRVLHLNDAHPEDASALLKDGTIDLVMLQYSGASWYPVVYDFPEKEKLALCELKRNNQTQRAFRYIQQLSPKFIVPCAGPACFLDDEFFYLNDFGDDSYSIFPDQKFFLDFLKQNQVDGGHLMLPGSSGSLDSRQFSVSHTLSESEIAEIFDNKRAYLKSYQESRRAEIDDLRNSWGDNTIDLLPALREWWLPLLKQANKICAGVDGNVVLDVGDEQIVIDFISRKVRAWAGEPWKYYFSIDRKLIETCIKEHFENWPAELFLSLRMNVQRVGKYDECVYGFFRCLSRERIEYFEKHYREYSGLDEMCSIDGYRLERFCPHMKVDLQSYGSIEGDILTCRRHGWEFNLTTGECLTSKNYSLRVESRTIDQAGS
jgi:UDP-MurNAc hydroxylase